MDILSLRGKIALCSISLLFMSIVSHHVHEHAFAQEADIPMITTQPLIPNDTESSVGTLPLIPTDSIDTQPLIPSS